MTAIAKNPQWTVGPGGPTTDPPKAGTVAFLESTSTLQQAQVRRQELLKELKANGQNDVEVVTFFRFPYEGSGTFLCQVEPFPLSTASVGCDLFLVSKPLLTPENRAELLRQVVRVVDDFSHQRPPGGGGPP